MRWARGIWSPLFSTLLLDCRGRHRQALLWMLSIRRCSMSGMLLYEGIISCCIFTWWLHLLRIEAAREESVAGHVRLVHCGLSLKYFAFLVCSTTSWGATALPIIQCGAKVSLSGSVAMLGSRKPNRRFLQQTLWLETPTLSKDKIREHFVLFLLAICRQKSFRIRHHASLLCGHRCDAKDFRDHRSWTSNLSKNLSKNFMPFAKFLCAEWRLCVLCDWSLIQGSNRSVYDITVYIYDIYIIYLSRIYI